MKTRVMPIEEGIYRNKEYMERHLTNIAEFFGFLDVTVITPKDLNIPIFPHRISNNKGIIYPLDIIIRGTYFSEELKLAVKHGYRIKEIHSAYEYKEKVIIFDVFVNDIYSKRINASSLILEDVYKKILNSLYGRFGLVYDRIETIRDTRDEDYYITENTKEFIDETSKTIYNNISITAAIASYGRIFMYNTISNNNLDVIYIGYRWNIY